MLSLLKQKPPALFVLLALVTIYFGASSSLRPQNRPVDHHTSSFSPYVALEYGVADIPRAVDFYAQDTKPNAMARAAFDRFKKLDGQWIGRSTKGWEEAITFKTIAKGSVVVENSFDAHPNETMMTMFHLDRQRLLLTHYCVAGNQPRLEATSFENEGQTVTFTFIDATNLPSRDKGHMDKAMFRFADDNHFSSQWTWYQDGKERWMEEIKYERKP